MRNLKFRIWDGLKLEYNVMVGKFGVFYVNPENGDGLDPDDSASLSKNNTKYNDDVITMLSTGIHVCSCDKEYCDICDDHDLIELYEGDIVENRSKYFCEKYDNECNKFVVAVSKYKKNTILLHKFYTENENDKNHIADYPTLSYKGDIIIDTLIKKVGTIFDSKELMFKYIRLLN